MTAWSQIFQDFNFYPYFYFPTDSHKNRVDACKQVWRQTFFFFLKRNVFQKALVQLLHCSLKVISNQLIVLADNLSTITTSDHNLICEIFADICYESASKFTLNVAYFLGGDIFTTPLSPPATPLTPNLSSAV